MDNQTNPKLFEISFFIMYYSPVEFDQSVFRGMDDVLWLILILWDFPSRNQPDATVAPLGGFF